ncbi:FlgD immunoglobulin-like domain containing protein [Streptomyces sp. NPDC058405]|uniref:FlgD immunoglobulin-like domain containing protein n=1 Tax=Streptomyces sp. NPDC058405 TaxID=3346482 RepID=UPI0036574DFD
MRLGRYLTADRTIEIVPTGVPTLPLTVTESQIEEGATPTRAEPWQAVWQLSKPAAWTLTLTDSRGTLVRTLTGATTGAAVRAAWDGANTAGGRPARGTFTWKLVAQPRDGSGADLVATGTTATNG